MQLETKKEDILKGLQTVQNGIAQKNTLPILSNILLEAENDELSLTATDLDIGISSKVTVVVKTPGSITVPAKKLIDIIKELPANNPLVITLKKNNMINIESGTVHCKIIGLPKDEFPQIPVFKNKESAVIPQGLLKDMLALTHFAVSKDETRYVLNGVLFKIEKDSIKLVATDGRRLAVASKQLPEKSTLVKTVIIPIRTVQEIMKLLGGDDAVKIVATENQTSFEIGKTRVITRLIEGEFPNYEDVIPKEKKEKAKVSTDLFLSATKRASLFTNPDSLAIKLELTKNKITVSKSAPYIGEVKEEITAVYSGKNLSIGFNPAYLIDILGTTSDNEVEFEFDDADRPAVLRKGEEYTYIVLPMQLT